MIPFPLIADQAQQTHLTLPAYRMSISEMKYATANRPN